MTDGPFYWSLVDRRVVTEADEVKAEDRLGPYATREEAQLALQHAQANTEAWDAEEDAAKEEAGADEWEKDSEGWGPFKH